LILGVCAVLAAFSAALSGQDRRTDRPRHDRGRWSLGVPRGKNESAVKSAFQGVLRQASAATVRILADGEQVALGAVVEADGYLVSKASVLDGKITCRFQDGTEKPAQIVGRDDDHDLALLRVPAGGLPTVPWRQGDPPSPGSFVATSSPTDVPVAIGVVSTGLRTVPARGSPNRPRSWLGVWLEGGQSGPGVKSVASDSPAAKAGIRPGDEIRQINGIVMKSADQIVQSVGRFLPGQTITLLIHRPEKDLEVSATLAQPRVFQVVAPEDDWGGGPFSERRWGFPLVLPHDTPLRPKDCGGPLVDTDGQVVGINIARALRVTTYALPESEVRAVVRALKQKLPRDTKP
jgi:serine protease Do